MKAIKTEGLASPQTADEFLMRAALREAERAAAQGEVPVGAVVVSEGRIISRAHNQPLHLNDPTAHAEILALRRAARRLGNYRLSGCTLYVTIEPCVMCAGALGHARVRRVVFGAPDRKAGACGSALMVLNHPRFRPRIEITGGVLSSACGAMLRQFFVERRHKNRHANAEGERGLQTPSGPLQAGEVPKRS